MQPDGVFAVTSFHGFGDFRNALDGVQRKGFAVQCVEQQVQPLFDPIHLPFLT